MKAGPETRATDEITVERMDAIFEGLKDKQFSEPTASILVQGLAQGGYFNRSERR